MSEKEDGNRAGENKNKNALQTLTEKPQDYSIVCSGNDTVCSIRKLNLWTYRVMDSL